MGKAYVSSSKVKSLIYLENLMRSVLKLFEQLQSITQRNIIRVLWIKLLLCQSTQDAENILPFSSFMLWLPSFQPTSSIQRSPLSSILLLDWYFSSRFVQKRKVSNIHFRHNIPFFGETRILLCFQKLLNGAHIFRMCNASL